MSHFLRILIFLKTRSTLVRGRMMICSFILLPRQLLLLSLLRSNLLSLRSTLDDTPQSQACYKLLRHQIQFLVMIFLLLSIKVNVSVLIQFLLFALMTICPHSPVLLLHPWTLFLCLTRFLKPSLILVGVVL